MILAVDMGNTAISCGLYQGETLVNRFNLLTDINKGEDEYELMLRIKLKEFDHIDGAIISSVVPSLTILIRKIIKTIYKIDPLVIGLDNLKSGIRLKIDNPKELGADLLCDVVSLKKKYKESSIVVDLGTASKFLVINKDSDYVGGVIVAGIKTSVKALIKNTELLPNIMIEAPKHIVAKNSIDSLNAGAIYGAVAMIRELTNMIEKEIGYKLNKVLTGGYAELVVDFLKDFDYQPNFTLDGANELFIKNMVNKDEK